MLALSFLLKANLYFLFQPHLADHPRDMQFLRHDKTLHSTQIKPYMKHVPDYLSNNLQIFVSSFYLERLHIAISQMSQHALVCLSLYLITGIDLPKILGKTQILGWQKGGNS